MPRPKGIDLALFGLSVLIYAGALLCLFLVNLEVASLVAFVATGVGWWSFRRMERDQRRYFREKRRATTPER